MLKFQHCAICSCFFCSLTFPQAVSNLDIREKIRQQAHEDFEVVSWKRSCESHTETPAKKHDRIRPRNVLKT